MAPEQEMPLYPVCTFHKCGSNWFRDIFWHIADRTDAGYLPFPARRG